MPDLPELVFTVPRGFEDVAAEDILRFLPVEHDNIEVSHPSDSGHVRLKVQSLSELGACLQTYDSGKLWVVLSCILSIGEPMRVPGDLFDTLQRERQALPSKRSRAIVDPGDSRARLSKRRTKLAPLEADTTLGEHQLLDHLLESVKSREGHFLNVLEIWKEFKHGPGTGEGLPESFAVRAERREFLFPTLKSSKVAGLVGSELADSLCRYTNKEKQKVDLNNPDLEILVEFVNNSTHGSEMWSLLYGVVLPPPRQSPAHRPIHRQFGRTSLLPQRAYCLCLLHPYLAPSSIDTNQQRVASLFLDPCSGFGAIPIELSAMSARDQLRLIPLAADNELPSLENASKNYGAAGTSGRAGLGGVDSGLVWDVQGKGRSGGLRSGVLDAVCTDLPWGVRELSSKAINALYPALLHTLANATAEGAYAVFLSGKKKHFDSALEANASFWEPYSDRIVNVEGIQAHAIVLRRKEHF